MFLDLFWFFSTFKTKVVYMPLFIYSSGTFEETLHEIFLYIGLILGAY